jgi:DNA helicase-2/ATP-dependent DNA helicase PcrA
VSLWDQDEETEAQHRAVHHAGSVLVLGRAGTGKTYTLGRRYRHLIATGTAPERIAYLAPTVAAATAARERIETALQGGYEELHIATPLELAAELLDRSGGEPDTLATMLGAGDRLAMLLRRIDELSLRHHDIGGSASSLLARFVRRIDRLKAELVSSEAYTRWAAALPDDATGDVEREFAAVYAGHEAMLRSASARDAGDVLAQALRLTRARERPLFEHVLIDDAQELDLLPLQLVLALGASALTAAGDAAAAVRRLRAAPTSLETLRAREGVVVVELSGGKRSRPAVAAVADRLLGNATEFDNGRGAVAFWRCANERAQAQGVAADIERLVAREHVPPGRIAVLVPSVAHEGQAVAVALEERAVRHRVVGDAAFFQRAEIRDLLAWLRLLADPADAGAVVRALARPPIELRSVDIARCTQIARRRKLDMVAALAAATESPQVPPEARERIRVFLKLYRSGMAALDTMRPDLYVHRLIERLGLRRQQLFAAQADIVERLRALARFAELASAHVRRAPQATAREFALSVAAVADSGLREREEPALRAPDAVQVLELAASAGLECDHVYVVGLRAGLAAPVYEAVPDALLREPLPPESAARALANVLYVAVTRARERLVLCYPAADGRGATVAPLALIDEARAGAGWEDVDEELFGPAETLHSLYRLLRDELLQGVARTGGRLGELRFDTDLDVSHAVVRYLELLKLSAVIARPEGQALAEAVRDVNARILQAVTAEQREIYLSSALDDYLLDSERDARRRASAVAARDEPSLEQFLPRRGEGVILSASDIDTYRTCPLKYKFARVFRIPQEPTLHQRFGIAVHQVLERYHAASGASGGLPELLGLLDGAWRRGGFSDSEEERQLRGKAVSALTRYYERSRDSDAKPVWFEKSFAFKLGPHLLRGRVDRVDRLPDGDYELIDYKTGRPKSAAQLADDVQLSLYAIGAREAWQLESSSGAYWYLLDDEKVTVACDDGAREWIREVATEVAEGILSQGFEPTPSFSACSICDYRLVCPAAER